MIQKFENFINSLNESKNIDLIIEDIFFLWDDIINDNRENISKCQTTYKNRKCYQFDFKWKKENFKFIKKAEELLNKNKIEFEFNENQLYVYF